jgi:hypothetical protein
MTSDDLPGAVWRKSTRSDTTANCVEVTTWRKSTRSNSTANCVEIAHGHTLVATRDSKNTTGPVLAFSPTHWSTFLRHLTNDRF